MDGSDLLRPSILLPLATLVIAAFVGVLMLRRPVLVRIAARNAVRRPRQTAMVIAGLMVGTAIVSASLVAGGSAGYAIRGYVYQSLGDIDESVAVPGYPYFPAEVTDAIRADDQAGFFDGVTSYSIWQAAAENPRSDQYEPTVSLVGYEPDHTAGFADFQVPGGAPLRGDSLGHGQGILTQHAAEALDAHVGDTLTVSYTPPIDPLLPEVFPFAGNLTASADANGLLNETGVPTVPGVPAVPDVPLPPSQVPMGAIPDDARFRLAVNASATRLTIVVGWDPTLTPPPLPPTPGTAGAPHFVVRVTAPNGTLYASPPQGSPAFLNLTAPPGHPLPAGNWSVQITADASIRTPYRGAAIVVYPVYDLERLQARAATLQHQYGDEVQKRIQDLAAFAPRRTSNITIAAITDGGRGSLFDLRDAIFMRLDDQQGMLDRQGLVNLVVLSNPGDLEEGAAGTPQAVQLLNQTLTHLRSQNPGVPSYASLQVRTLKREYIAVADQTGQTFTNLLVFAGSLTIITGLLLLLNIFTVLAEERRSELGMARAVGMRRWDLVQSFVFEGSLYALGAAFVGALLGLALAAGMIAILNAVIGSLASKLSFPPIPFRPTIGDVAIAFAVGSLVTFATIFGAANRKARLNVVRAIRRIEEPDLPDRGGRGLATGIVLLALGIVVTLFAWLAPPPQPDETLLRAILWHRVSLRVAGPFVTALGWALVLRRFLARRYVFPAAAGALALAYAVNYFFLQRDANLTEANIVGPLRGVLLTLCVVVLVVHWEWLSRAVGRVLVNLRPMRALAIPAVSYPLHKKSRTGLTLAMFSVVILSIAFFSIFGALFQTDPARQTGGYDIEARPTLTVDDLSKYGAGSADARLVEVQDHLRDYISEAPNFITVGEKRTGSFGDYRHHVFGFDADFAQHQQFRLLSRDPAYASDEAAYADVFDHDDRVIVAYPYSTSERNEDRAHLIRENLVMHIGKQDVALRIVGIQEQYHFTGIFLGKAQTERLFPTAADLYLIRLVPELPAGVTAETVAHDLERDYRAVGLDAKSSVSLVLQEQKSFRQILGAMKLFLGLGLVVGVLSLGIVTSRNVLERRQEIGVLRAIGYTRRQVRRLFFTEMTYTLALGGAIGVGCAILVTYGLWFSVIRELNYPYVVPWQELGILVGVAYIVALIATAAPIGRAGKVAPAEALRYLE